MWYFVMVLQMFVKEGHQPVQNNYRIFIWKCYRATDDELHQGYCTFNTIYVD